MKIYMVSLFHRATKNKEIIYYVMLFVSTCKIQHASFQENIEYISCYHYHIIPLGDRNGDSVAGMTWDPDKIICRDILYHAAPFCLGSNHAALHSCLIVYVKTSRISTPFTLNCTVFGQPFVKWFALCHRTVVCPLCLSCLSVTLMYCGQTVGWIKTSLDVEVGLDPGNTVLDGDPAPFAQKGHNSPNFQPMSVVVKRLDGSWCHLVGR